MSKLKSTNNKIVIGIDQSYQDTGISIAHNGKLKAENAEISGTINANDGTFTGKIYAII